MVYIEVLLEENHIILPLKKSYSAYEIIVSTDEDLFSWRSWGIKA